MLPWLTPYFISIAVALGITVYAWRRRAETVPRAFAAYAGSSALIAFGALSEHLAPTLKGKVFWENVQFVGMFATTLAFAAFTSRYTGRRILKPQHCQIGFALVLALAILLAFTNPLHGWLRSDVRLSTLAARTLLVYEFTPLFYAIVVCVYTVLGYALLLLSDEILRGHAPYIRQAAILLAGALVPWGASALALLEVPNAPHQDPTAFGIAVGNTILAFGLYRYHILDLVPLARHVTFNAMSEGVIVLDAHGIVVNANPSFLKGVGLQSAQIIGHAAVEILHPDPELLARFTSKARFRQEISASIHGHPRRIELVGTPLHDTRGGIAGWVVVVRDVTERHEVQDALRQAHDELEVRVLARTAELTEANARLREANTQLEESENRYRALFEKANDAIFIAKDGLFAQCNRRAIQLLRCADSSQIIGQPITRFCSPFQLEGRDCSAVVRENTQRALQGESLTFEWQHLTYNGLQLDTEVSLTRLDASGGPYILSVVRDMTERKQAERELAHAREQLRLLTRNRVQVQEEERAVLARELHDELGQALSYQILNLTMLRRHLDDPRAVAARAAETAHLAEEMLESIHRMALNLRPIVLDHLGLVSALQQYADEFADPTLTLSFDTVGLDPRTRFAAEAEIALYRVVQEALTNVVRHAGAQRVDILLEHPQHDDRRDCLIMLIEDDGIGFDPVTALHSDRLGLLSMRERVEALGGALTLESSPGYGTTILVEVPYAPIDPTHSHPDR